MIISCSRRTDIPAFYARWFIKRIRQGFCYVPNPFNTKQLASVSLDASDVDVIVFWTKDPRLLLPFLEELDDRGFRYYFQYTLNDYPRALEPGMRPLAERLATFKNLASRIGANRVIWRYDPIIFSNQTPAAFHVDKVKEISKALSGSTERCIVSIVDVYRKTKRGLEALKEEGIETDLDPLNSRELPVVLPQIVEIAAKAGIEVFSCAEGETLAKYGITYGKCIDDRLIRILFNIDVTAEKDKYQRDLCGCVASRDIGMNDTCLHGCSYCYATNSLEKAKKNNSLHNPDSPMLIGEPPSDAEILFVRKAIARNERQGELF